MIQAPIDPPIDSAPERLADRLRDIENHVEAAIRRGLDASFQVDEVVAKKFDATEAAVTVSGHLWIPPSGVLRREAARCLRAFADRLEQLDFTLRG